MFSRRQIQIHKTPTQTRLIACQQTKKGDTPTTDEHYVYIRVLFLVFFCISYQRKNLGQQHLYYI